MRMQNLQKVSRKANEISVEWLELKDAGKIHRVNVKHIICQLSEIAVGKQVIVRLNTHQYRAKVADLLDWAPPKPKGISRKKKRVEKVRR